MVQVANSSLPAFITRAASSSYVTSCRVDDDGMAVISAPVFSGVATLRQTALAAYTVPSTPVAGDLNPVWEWMSSPVDPRLQDTPVADAMVGGIYAFASWGGAAGTNGSSTPPTVHVFRTDATGFNPPIAQMRTASPWRTTAGAVSGSPAAIDLAVESHESNSQTLSVLVLAAGQDCHANIGSAGGLRYLWRVKTPAALRSEKEYHLRK